MTKQDLLDLLNNQTIPNDAEIEINSIVNKNNELGLSSICEAHYDKNLNTVCITPTMVGYW